MCYMEVLQRSVVEDTLSISPNNNPYCTIGGCCKGRLTARCLPQKSRIICSQEWGEADLRALKVVPPPLYPHDKHKSGRAQPFDPPTLPPLAPSPSPGKGHVSEQGWQGRIQGWELAAGCVLQPVPSLASIQQEVMELAQLGALRDAYSLPRKTRSVQRTQYGRQSSEIS